MYTLSRSVKIKIHFLLNGTTQPPTTKQSWRLTFWIVSKVKPIGCKTEKVIGSFSSSWALNPVVPMVKNECPYRAGVWSVHLLNFKRLLNISHKMALFFFEKKTTKKHEVRRPLKKKNGAMTSCDVTRPNSFDLRSKPHKFQLFNSGGQIHHCIAEKNKWQTKQAEFVKLYQHLTAEEQQTKINKKISKLISHHSFPLLAILALQFPKRSAIIKICLRKQWKNQSTSSQKQCLSIRPSK